jgi:hypothetical protein
MMLGGMGNPSKQDPKATENAEPDEKAAPVAALTYHGEAKSFWSTQSNSYVLVEPGDSLPEGVRAEGLSKEEWY